MVWQEVSQSLGQVIIIFFFTQYGTFKAGFVAIKSIFYAILWNQKMLLSSWNRHARSSTVPGSD